MSKVSFRARALDATKLLPIFHATDIPDISDYSVINRTVPQMPTGMEKEEETVGEKFGQHMVKGRVRAAILKMADAYFLFVVRFSSPWTVGSTYKSVLRFSMCILCSS